MSLLDRDDDGWDDANENENENQKHNENEFVKTSDNENDSERGETGNESKNEKEKKKEKEKEKEKEMNSFDLPHAHARQFNCRLKAALQKFADNPSPQLVCFLMRAAKVYRTYLLQEAHEYMRHFGETCIRDEHIDLCIYRENSQHIVSTKESPYQLYSLHHRAQAYNALPLKSIQKQGVDPEYYSNDRIKARTKTKTKTKIKTKRKTKDPQWEEEDEEEITC